MNPFPFFPFLYSPLPYYSFSVVLHLLSLFLTHQVYLACRLYVHLCRTIFWSMGSLLEVAFLKQTNSPTHSSHQLPIDPWVGVGLHGPPSIHDGILSSLILCRSCAWSLSFFEFICAVAHHVQEIVLLQTSTASGSYNLLLPPL